MRWHWQLISEHIGDDFAYTVHLKTTEPPPGARDKGRQELRVTQIYRHDNGKWKIVHRPRRHLADDITSPGATVSSRP
ncbi:MAG: hypothetical protein NVSMB25_17910 [Thermoleophilaceae bacterium]